MADTNQEVRTKAEELKRVIDEHVQDRAKAEEAKTEVDEAVRLLSQ